jgi:hypothetical protein
MTSASLAASGAVGAGAVCAKAGAIVVKESVARMVQHSIFDFKDIGFGPPKNWSVCQNLISKEPISFQHVHCQLSHPFASLPTKRPVFFLSQAKNDTAGHVQAATDPCMI